MRIATVQFSPIYADKKSNLDRIIRTAENTSADVIVFPELCTTGYYFLDKEKLAPMAEPFGGESCEEMQKIATSQGKIIVFGFAESDGPKLYNSAAMIFPDAEMSCAYRKTHLFYNEFQVFEPGNSGFFVIEDEDRDLRIGTMICYDWRFPESARSLALLGADLVVCPANLVTDRWHISMPSRALENKIYFAVANRSGTEHVCGEELIFKGKSAIYGFDGETLATAPAEGDAVIFADIDPASTRDKSFNPVNDIFDDRRPEMYFTD